MPAVLAALAAGAALAWSFRALVAPAVSPISPASIVPPRDHAVSEARLRALWLGLSVPRVPQAHRVSRGETLSGLALQYFGTADAYPLLMAANPGIRPESLPIGRVLKVPRLGVLSPPPAGWFRTVAEALDAHIGSDWQVEVATSTAEASASVLEFAAARRHAIRAQMTLAHPYRLDIQPQGDERP